MTETAQWTWLVYMAGDNNLQGAGSDDLDEMKEVGSTPDVNVVVQFDKKTNKAARYRVEKGKLKTIDSMPGVDCGDPKVLTQFVKWGIKKYPAQHYLLDVWNHGGGWENLPADFDYDSIRLAKPQAAARLQRVKRSLFRTTPKKIARRESHARAVAIDCGSHDYLDNQELRDGVLKALPDGRKIDILGCDACLMNMLEIAYEMKDTADFMVGSEETEPAEGWPYAAILKKLVAEPAMAPADLAKVIVAEYGKYYEKTGQTATQSALDLGRVKAAGDAVSELADALMADIDSVAGGVSLAKDRVQRFEMPEYIDLGDFARRLAQRLPQSAAVQAATDKVLQSLQEAPGAGLVLANSTAGFRVQDATGASIYFPPTARSYAPDYSDLAFSKDGRWKAFLEALFQV